MASIIATYLGLLLLALHPVTVVAQSEVPYIGRWESAEQHFRLIIYRHQGSLQILFYGRVEIGNETQPLRYQCRKHPSGQRGIAI